MASLLVFTPALTESSARLRATLFSLYCCGCCGMPSSASWLVTRDALLLFETYFCGATPFYTLKSPYASSSFFRLRTLRRSSPLRLLMSRCGVSYTFATSEIDFGSDFSTDFFFPANAL